MVNRGFNRTDRLGEQVRRDLAEILRHEYDDPRLKMVSFTLVQVTRDLSLATVYFTYLGPVEARAEVLALLEHEAVPLRRWLGRGLRVRTVPKLRFVYDAIIERGAELSALIDAAVEHDRARVRDDEPD